MPPPPREVSKRFAPKGTYVDYAEVFWVIFVRFCRVSGFGVLQGLMSAAWGLSSVLFAVSKGPENVDLGPAKAAVLT